MVKLGWMADTHIPTQSEVDEGGASSGATDKFVTDYNKLVNNQGVDDIYFAGDACHAQGGSPVPRVDQDEYSVFWDQIAKTDDPDRLKYVVPGNHDIPIQEFVKSEERAVLRERVDYDADGVSVFVINTHPDGFVTAAPGGGGVTQPRLAYADLDWLDQQLADAGSNTKIVIPHAYLYPTIFTTIGGMMTSDKRYQVVSNYLDVHDVLKQYNKVVVPQAHRYVHSSSDEGSTTVDGVHYARTQHYYRESDDSVTTFNWITADSSSCTIMAEEHSDGTTYTDLDVTF